MGVIKSKPPDTQISDLIVTEKDLVVGTHGRSIYILDDISPIREMSDVNSENLSYIIHTVQLGEYKMQK